MDLGGPMLYTDTRTIEPGVLLLLVHTSDVIQLSCVWFCVFRSLYQDYNIIIYSYLCC